MGEGGGSWELGVRMGKCRVSGLWIGNGEVSCVWVMDWDGMGWGDGYPTAWLGEALSYYCIDRSV